MRTTPITVLGFCLAALVWAASEPQKPTADVPPGVGLEEWIPLGESFGFVVTSAATNRVEFVDNALYGYYVIKKSGRWYRTYPPEPPVRHIPLQTPGTPSPDDSSTNGVRRIPFRRG